MNGLRELLGSLPPWQRTGFTKGHMAGEVVLVRNGTELDIWLMVEDQPVLVSLPAREIRELVDPEWADGATRKVRATSRGMARYATPT
jgi:hypothetical protein